MRGDRSVAVDFSQAPGAEEIREIGRRGPQKMEVLGVTIQRCLSGRGMDGAVIGLITPLGEPFIQSG